MNIKKTAFFLFFICSFLFLNAQQDTIDKEIHISTNSLTLENLGLQYKWSKKSSIYYRVSLAKIRASYLNMEPFTSRLYQSKQTIMSLRLNGGVEKRKKLTGNLYLFYGINAILYASWKRFKVENPNIQERNRTNSDIIYFPGLGFNSGILWKLKESMAIAAEITPEFIYYFNKEETYKVSQLQFNLNTEAIKLSFIYTWNKIK
ncbi:MAG: hypothetical protein ACOCUV_01980 [bacterium]